MTQVVTSALDAVTVYHRGATVRRVITLTPDDSGALPAQIEIPGLPLALHAASVRLSADEAGQRAGLMATSVRVGVHVANAQAPHEAPSQQALRVAKREQASKQRALAHLESELGLLHAISIPPRPQGDPLRPPPASPMAARQALELVLHEAQDARDEARDELERELEVLTKEIARLEDEVRRDEQARLIAPSEVTRSVSATLRATGPLRGPVSLTLAYFVPGARWAPQYHVRLARGGAQAELQLRAVVSQASGEDWRGVALTLSTAHPTRWTELPKLASLRLGKQQPAPAQKTGFREPPRGAEALFRDMDRDLQQARQQLPPARGWQSPHLYRSPLPWPAFELEPIEPFEPPRAYSASYDEGAAMHEERAKGISYEVSASAMAAPMAPPMPPPMPAQARAAAPPLAAPAAPMRRERAMAKKMAALESGSSLGASKDAEGFGGGGRGGYADEGALEAYGAPDDYASLELGEPLDQRRRGKLHPIDARQRHRQDLARAGRGYGFDLEAMLQRASERAGMSAQGLPVGAFAVRQPDDQFDFSYATQDRVDVPADGSFHAIPVHTREVSCRVRYITVPREEPSVYRVAELENPSRKPLLAGQAEVYVDGDYVLTTVLPRVGPRERFTMGLGVEQAIKCARNTTYREARSGAAVVATAELHHTISVELVNHLDRPAALEVRERIPSPAPDAEVVVEEQEVSPAWEDYMQHDRPEADLLAGGKVWQITLAAGASQTLKAHYVVKIYANNELVGGNRREA